jgi:predicted nucleic acid-binding protein
MTPNDPNAQSATITPSGLLVDTNILLRLAHPPDPLHSTAVAFIARLTSDDVPLYIAPQTIYEFWVVATRPATARGGLGWTPAQADVETNHFEALFELLPETPDVYGHWRRLCRVHGVSGLSAHDARLVAFLLVHRSTHDLAGILTFNAAHFARYAAAPPQSEGIAVIAPSSGAGSIQK